MWVTQAVLAVYLVGCGGGGADGPSTFQPGSPTTVAVTPTVDSALIAQGALKIARTMTAYETKPVGSPITASAGNDPVVYALDAGGNIALAATITSGSAVFSAEGTVLALGANILRTMYPSATQGDLNTALRSSSKFLELVRDVNASVLAGKNPLDELAVQTGFNGVLTDSARITATPQESRVRVAAVAKDRAPDTIEPSVLETSTFKIAIANRLEKVPTFESKVLLRNTSTLTFKASLLDVNGAQRTSDTLQGSGPTIFTLQGVKAISIAKPFPGSFSVRLAVDDELTQIDFLKEALAIPNVLNSECVAAVATVAVKQLTSQARNVVFAQKPDEWLVEILGTGWDYFKDCAVPNVASPSVAQIIKGYFKITQIVGFGRFIVDRQLVPSPIEDTGVCLDERQYQMDCVSVITADAIKPMMPGAIQPINILMLDNKGRKTLAPPYDLKIEYGSPNLFELSSNMKQVTANRNNAEGTGTLKITDPATDTTFSMSVTVTNGKLEQAAYTVPPNGTVDVKLVDPVSGSEVYRSGYFDIYVADGSFGSFTPIKAGLGALTFHASGLATPAPQPIRFNGPKDSGSTMTVGVEEMGRNWTGTNDVPTSYTGGLPTDGSVSWSLEPYFYVAGPTPVSVGGSFRFNGGQPGVMVTDGNYFFQHYTTTTWDSSSSSMTYSIPVYATVNNALISVTRTTTFFITSRTATEMSGHYEVSTTAGGYLATPSGPQWVTAPMVARGIWRAQRYTDPVMKTPNFNGYPICDRFGNAHTFEDMRLGYPDMPKRGVCSFG